VNRGSDAVDASSGVAEGNGQWCWRPRRQRAGGGKN
jgi:hypothetical protein